MRGQESHARTEGEGCKGAKKKGSCPHKRNIGGDPGVGVELVSSKDTARSPEASNGLVSDRELWEHYERQIYEDHAVVKTFVCQTSLKPTNWIYHTVVFRSLLFLLALLRGKLFNNVVWILPGESNVLCMTSSCKNLTLTVTEVDRCICQRFANCG